MKIKKYIDTQTIQFKLIASLSLIFIIILIIGIFGFYSIKRIKYIYTVKENFFMLKNISIQIRGSANAFILNDVNNIVFFETRQSRYLEQVENSISEFKFITDSLLKDQAALSGLLVKKDIKNLQKNITNYSKTFNSLVKKIQQRGTGRFGLVGKFEASMTELEKKDYGTDNRSLANIKLAISHYLLTGDTNLIRKVQDAIFTFSTVLEKHIDNTQVEQVAEILANFELSFLQLSQIDRLIGANNSSGIKKQLHLNLLQTNAELDRLEAHLNAVSDTMISHSIRIFVACIATAALIMLLIASILPPSITKPLAKMEQIISQISKGDIPDTVKITTKGELGRMAKALQLLADNLHVVSDFAKSVGKGEFESELSVFDTKSTLGSSLAGMRDNLKNVAEIDRQRAWINEGLNKFSEINRTQNNPDNYAQESIQFVCKYINAQQGACYLAGDDGKSVVLCGKYAFTDRENQNSQILKPIASGQGLVGQCFKEGSEIAIDKLPENYLLIESGLGYSIPKSLFIIALTYNEQSFGVLEIAGFEDFDTYKKEFVRKISQSMAVAVSGLLSTKIN